MGKLVLLLGFGLIAVNLALTKQGQDLWEMVVGKVLPADLHLPVGNVVNPWGGSGSPQPTQPGPGVNQAVPKVY